MLAASLLALSQVLVTAPPGAGWELLGARRVNFAAERDVIAVGARDGAFTAIRIEVQGGDLEMYDIRLTFGNGDTWSPNTRVVFGAGSRSRTIDLPGGARVIGKVDFWYRSRLRQGQAGVRVYGRKAGAAVGQADKGAEPAPPLGAVGTATSAVWERLGSRRVNFRVDRDAIAAAGKGAFRAIRLDVEGGDLELYDVMVTFGNGKTYSPGTRLVFRQGSRSRVINLPGEYREIRRIDFLYRSLAASRRGRATIHAFGLR